MSDSPTQTSEATDTPKRRSRKVAASPMVPFSAEPPPNARIVSMKPRAEVSPVKKGGELKAEGEYRVIHGQVHVALPPESFMRPDGSEIPHAPKYATALPGDIVWLNGGDATRLWNDKLIESLDAKPSRVGQGCTLPLRDRKSGSAMGTVAPHVNHVD